LLLWGWGLTTSSTSLSASFVSVKLHKVLLLVVVFFSLHDNVLAEIFITVHAGGEVVIASWSVVSSLDSRRFTQEESKNKSRLLNHIY